MGWQQQPRVVGAMMGRGGGCAQGIVRSCLTPAGWKRRQLRTVAEGTAWNLRNLRRR